VVLMDKYKNLQIEEINVMSNTYSDFNIDITWSCYGKGWGHINLGKDDDKYYIQDEYMSKEFVMKVFEKLYDMCKEEE
jgi:hypothetical protein